MAKKKGKKAKKAWAEPEEDQVESTTSEVTDTESSKTKPATTEPVIPESTAEETTTEEPTTEEASVEEPAVTESTATEPTNVECADPKPDEPDAVEATPSVPEHTDTDQPESPQPDTDLPDTETTEAPPEVEAPPSEDSFSSAVETALQPPSEPIEDPTSIGDTTGEEPTVEEPGESETLQNESTSSAEAALEDTEEKPTVGVTTSEDTEGNPDLLDKPDRVEEETQAASDEPASTNEEEPSQDTAHSDSDSPEAPVETTPEPAAEAPSPPDASSEEDQSDRDTYPNTSESSTAGAEASDSSSSSQEAEQEKTQVAIQEPPASLRSEVTSASRPPAAPTPPVGDRALPAGPELPALPPSQSGRIRPSLDSLEDPFGYRAPPYHPGHPVGRSFSGGYFPAAPYSHSPHSHIPPVGSASPPVYSDHPPHFYRRSGQGSGSHGSHGSSFSTNMSTPMQARQPPFAFPPGAAYPQHPGQPNAYAYSRRTGSFDLRAGEYGPEFQEHAIIDDDPEEEEDVHIVSQIQSVIPAINSFLYRQKERQSTIGMREMTMREQLTAHQEARKNAEDQVQRHTELSNSFRERLESATKSYESEIGKFRLQIGDLEEKRKDMEERVAEAREAKGFLQAQKEGMKKELEIAKRDLDTHKTTLEELEAAKASLETEKSDLVSRLEEVEKEKAANEEAAKEEHEKLLQEKLAAEEAAKEEKDKLQQEKDAAEESAKQATSEVEQLQQALEDLKAQTEETIKQEKERLENEFEEKHTKATEELEADKLLIAEEFGRRLAGKQTEVDEMKETLDKNTQELGASNEAKAALETQLAELREQLEAASTKAEEAEKAFAAEREEMEKKLEEQRQQLEKQWQEKHDELNKQHEATKEEHATSMDGLREEHKRQLTEITADHETSLTDIRAEHQRQLDDERENLSKQKEEAAGALAEMQADLTKQLEEAKQKSGQEIEAMAAEFGKSKGDLERAITELQTVADNLDLEKGRLQKVIECFGDVVDLKGKGDSHYRNTFSQLSKQIFDFASNNSDTHPSAPAPADLIASLPSSFPSFHDDTTNSRHLRAACIAHIISRKLTVRIFKPFLFSLGQSNPDENALLSSLSKQIREKSVRKEAIWRQHTLVAAFTMEGAKQNINNVAASVVNEILDEVAWFTENTEKGTLQSSVKAIVKLAVETWRFARLEREVIVAEMPDQDEDEPTGSQFWMPLDFATVRGESGSVCSLSLTEGVTSTATEVELPSSKILLRVFPAIRREPIHEDLQIKEEEKEDNGFIYSKGFALYEDAESVLARRREVELAESPPVASPTPSRPPSRALTTATDPPAEQGEDASEDGPSTEEPILLLRVPPPRTDIASPTASSRPPTPPADEGEASNRPTPHPSPLIPPADDVVVPDDAAPEAPRPPSGVSLNEVAEQPNVNETPAEDTRGVDVGPTDADAAEHISLRSRPGSIRSVSTASHSNNLDEQGSHRSSRSISVRSSVVIQNGNSAIEDRASLRSKTGSIRSVGTETSSGDADEQGSHRSKSGSVRSITIQRNRSLDDQGSYRSKAGSLKSMSTETSRSSRFHVESNQAAIKALYGNTARTRAALLERTSSTGSVRPTRSERSEADTEDIYR